MVFQIVVSRTRDAMPINRDFMLGPSTT